MLLFTDRFVLGMALLRLLSASIEFSAALLMLWFNSTQKALQINAVLALVGPTVLRLVTAVGLAGLAGKVPVEKLIYIVAGVVLIFYGVHKT